MSKRDDEIHGPNHTGQHRDCGSCNGIRFDRAKARREAAENPNRVVAAEDDWRIPPDEPVTEADTEFARRMLERCFKGSQASFNAGVATPGGIGITNFIVGLLLGARRQDVSKRIRRGLEAASAKATGLPAEHYEKEINEMMDEMEKILREEGAG